IASGLDPEPAYLSRMPLGNRAWPRVPRLDSGAVAIQALSLRGGIGLIVVLLARAVAGDEAKAPDTPAQNPAPPVAYDALFLLPSDTEPRSEERRVGKEEKSRGAAYP